MTKTAIEKAIQALGGPTKTAAALGISNASVVANWQKRGFVSVQRVLALEAASGISKHELRPDVFGPDEKGKT